MMREYNVFLEYWFHGGTTFCHSLKFAEAFLAMRELFIRGMLKAAVFTKPRCDQGVGACIRTFAQAKTFEADKVRRIDVFPG
jgi:hypothetical protein